MGKIDPGSIVWVGPVETTQGHPLMIRFSRTVAGAVLPAHTGNPFLVTRAGGYHRVRAMRSLPRRCRFLPWQLLSHNESLRPKVYQHDTRLTTAFADSFAASRLQRARATKCEEWERGR